jgi:hypothetical protein
MSAKEMFEKLGYENDEVNEHSLGYGKLLNNRKKYITFNDSGNCKWFTIIETDRNNPTIDLEELKAINQQCRELGWLDE